MPNEIINLSPNVTMYDAEKATPLVVQALRAAKYEVGGVTVVSDPYNPTDGTVHTNRGMIVAEIYVKDIRGNWGLSALRQVMRNLRRDHSMTPIPFVRFEIKQANRLHR